MVGMLKSAHARLLAKPKVDIGIWSLLAVTALGIIDLRTGSEISFSIFYLIPVSVAAWYVSLGAAMSVSFAAAAAWLAADLLSGHEYSHGAIPIWNSFVRLGFFAAFGWLTSSIRARLNEEENLADTDSLTSLANSRSFYEKVDAEIVRQRRYCNPFTLAYVDLDNFKQVNDRWGHDSGDDLLVKVARILKDKSRESDTPARLGGDEFAILFPMTGSAGARAAVSSLMAALLESMTRDLWPVTFSVGVVTFLDTPVDAREALKAADDRMYSAKRGGKNCAVYEVWRGPTQIVRPPAVGR